MKRSGFKRKASAAPLKRKAILRSGRNTLRRLVVDMAKLDPTKRLAARADRIAMRTGKGKLIARRSTTAHARRERFYDYMGWIHTLPCLLGGARVWSIIEPEVLPTTCGGPIQADHAGDRYRGRGPDSTCIPLCEKHHRERTNGTSVKAGAFARHPAARMREWRLSAVEHVQLYALRAGVVVPDDPGRCAAYIKAAAATPAAAEGIPF